LAGKKFPAGAFQSAELGRGGGNYGEGGSASKVDAQGFTHKLGAAAVFGFAGALNLPGDRLGQ